MKKFLIRALSLVLACMMLAPLAITAAHPNGYWPYHVAYQDALATGDIDEILRTGDALLDFYSNYEINTDIAGNSFNVYYYRYFNSIFEKRGDYEAARENLEKLLYVAEIAGITDIDIITEAKIRKIDPDTGVYALTSSPEHALYYGAKNELRNGVYYGSVLSVENYKVKDKEKIANESIASIYIELGQEKLGDFSWLLNQVYFSNKALHVAFNFPKEGTTVKEVNQGMHDSNIRENLKTVAKLKQPVFFRIGAEMNVWSNKTEPEEFKAAYIRIANMAREIAPNAALIFSVNHVGSYGGDMSVYYPGDEYVDWVGVSLYYNRYRNIYTLADGEDFDNLYFGAGEWADPIDSVAEVVEKFGDRKPIMVTEGGASHHLKDGTDLSDFAASRVNQAYRALTMIYPQIKGIIYFDTNVNGSSYFYDIEQSPKTAAAYNEAVAANKTLVHDYREDGLRYVPIEKFCEKTDTVSIFAYSDPHYNGAVKVDYYLDGTLQSTTTDVVHEFSLPAASLSVGTHTFKAVFSATNFSQTLEYKLVKNSFGVVEFVKAGEKMPVTDVSSWALKEVNCAVELDLVPDNVLTDFTSKITRAEFCTVIMRLISRRLDKSGYELLKHFRKAVNVDIFTDTKQEDVLIANALGILNGRGNGIFDPESSITRQEAAVMLYNAAKLMGIDKGEGTSFADSDKFASWAASAIDFVSSVKDKTTGSAVMGGVGGGKFDPQGTYTKEQAILTAVRLFGA